MVPFFLGLLLIFFLPSPTWAASGVVINELLPDPSSGHDWVEFYNPTDSDINLSGWKLKDTNVSDITTFGPTSIVPAKDFFVFEDAGDRLNKSGDTIYLKDSSGVTIDTRDYSSSSLDTSIGRSPDGSDNWTSFPAPSKGAANSSSPAPTQTVTIGGISLSEFLPNPESGGQEWVELFNDNLTTQSVTGFKIDDIDGGSSPYTIPEETIPAKGYLFVMLPSSILNNDTDTIRLLSPNGATLESYTYAKSTKNYSWIKSGNGWEETSTPTLGAANQLTALASSTNSPTKTPTKKEEVASTKKATTPPPSSVLASKTVASTTPIESTNSASPSGSVSTIKLNLKGDEEKVAVLGNSYSKQLSYALILLGAIVIIIPIGIFIKKKRD